MVEKSKENTALQAEYAEDDQWKDFRIPIMRISLKSESEAFPDGSINLISGYCNRRDAYIPLRRCDYTGVDIRTIISSCYRTPNPSSIER